MTKDDVLKMNSSREIMRALTDHKSLWCKETSDHLRNIKRKENLSRYGTEFIYTDPAKNVDVDR